MTAMDAMLARFEDNNLGVVGVSLFAGTESDLPAHGDGFLTIIETGGDAPIGTHNEGNVVLRRPAFQITARARRYPVASELIHRAYVVSTFSNLLIGDRFFLHAIPLQEPFSLPNDPNGRVRLAFNLATLHR